MIGLIITSGAMIVFSPMLWSTLLDLLLSGLVLLSPGPLTEMVTGGIWVKPRTFLVYVAGASFLGLVNVAGAGASFLGLVNVAGAGASFLALVNVAGLNEGRFPTDLRSLAGNSFSRRIVVDAVEENGF